MIDYLFLFSVVLDFSLENYLQRYNNKELKSFQVMNEKERTNITQPITSSGGKFEEKKRTVTYEHPILVNRFSNPVYIYNSFNI